MADQKFKSGDEVIYVGQCLDDKPGRNYIRREARITRLKVENGRFVTADLYFYMEDRAAILIYKHYLMILEKKERLGQTITQKDTDRVRAGFPKKVRVDVRNVPQADDPKKPGKHTFIFKDAQEWKTA